MQITAVGDEGTVDTELAGETFYKVTITCNVVAGENDGSVGSYENLAALKTAVTNLQYSTLTITLKATEVTPGA